MTETTDTTESESTITITLAKPDEVAYGELVAEFGDELLNADLTEVVKSRVRSLCDNQEEVRQALAAAQEQAATADIPPQ